MKNIKNLLLVLAMIAVSGCATQTFHMDGNMASTEAAPTQEEQHTFFLNGIGQQKQVDAAAVCGGADKVSKVETELTFLDIILGNVTFGIYTPRTARVYCAQ